MSLSTVGSEANLEVAPFTWLIELIDLVKWEPLVPSQLDVYALKRDSFIQ